MRVSVLVPCRNASAWVAEAIQSAIDQTSAPHEIIVLDDGSSDDTPSVLAGFGDSIRVLRGEPRGVAVARNRLVDEADGEWLQFLDADDVLHSKKLESQTRFSVGTDLIANPCIYEDGTVAHSPIGSDPWLCLMSSRLGVTSANLFRKQAVLAAGGWCVNQRAGQEYELMQRMLRSGARVAMTRQPLVTKRRLNPRSIWSKDRRVSFLASADNLVRAVEYLASQDALTKSRRRVASRRFFDIAANLWDLGEYCQSELLDCARRIDPAGRWLFNDSPIRRVRLLGRAMPAGPALRCLEALKRAEHIARRH